MNEMKRIFEAIYDLVQRKGTLEEALLYRGGNFSKIEYECNGETFIVSITKEDKNA